MLNTNLSKWTRKKVENIKIYFYNTEIVTLICREKRNSYSSTNSEKVVNNWCTIETQYLEQHAMLNSNAL